MTEFSCFCTDTDLIFRLYLIFNHLLRYTSYGFSDGFTRLLVINRDFYVLQILQSSAAI